MKRIRKNKNAPDTIPAIQPEDYKESVGRWMIALQERGLWNGWGCHGDVYLPADVYWQLLEDMEK